MEFIPCLKQLINYNFYHIYYRHALVKVVPLYHTIYIYITILYLVGGFNPSEKYWSVGSIIPNIWRKKICCKPPTRYLLYCHHYIYHHDLVIKPPVPRPRSCHCDGRPWLRYWPALWKAVQKEMKSGSLGIIIPTQNWGMHISILYIYTSYTHHIHMYIYIHIHLYIYTRWLWVCLKMGIQPNGHLTRENGDSVGFGVPYVQTNPCMHIWI